MKMISKDVLTGLLQNVKIGTRNNLKADCPFCAKDGHFYINYITGLHDCKKCGEQGNIVTFLREIGRLDLLQGEEVDFNSIKKLGEQNTTQNIEEIELSNCKLPIGFTGLSYGTKNAFNDYLKDRKFTKKDYELYLPGFTNLKQKYRDYVILQVHKDFLCKAYITRYIGEDENKPRYLNSISDFSKLLFGIDEVGYNTQSVIIGEGVFDKISITTELNLHNETEFKSLCSFGKKISEHQIHLLQKTKSIKNIFLLHDGRDAINDMKVSSYKLKDAGFKVFIGYLPVNDPGSCNANELLDVLNSAETPEQFWINKMHKRKLK